MDTQIQTTPEARRVTPDTLEDTIVIEKDGGKKYLVKAISLENQPQHLHARLEAQVELVNIMNNSDTRGSYKQNLYDAIMAGRFEVYGRCVTINS